MKKNYVLYLTMAALTLAATFTACNDDDETTVPVTGVTLNITDTTLTAGGTFTLVPTVAPGNATDKTVTWTSSNTATATVNNGGLVTAVAEGPATITVTTTDGSHTATCVVNVVASTVPVTGVTLSTTDTTLTVGDAFTLVPTIAPGNATDGSVTWTSSSTATATVDDNGLVTAVAEGPATITVTTTDGSHTATCTVTVEAATVDVTGISLNVADTTLSFIETLQLTATVLPAEATNPAITWSSSDNTIATVDATGLVTPAANAGAATITATAEDGSEITGSCTVTVNKIGQVSFKTTTTWPVSGNSITQEWSDVVMATGARKDTYNGGSAADGFEIDCRQNEGYGDLFSWVAVDTYKEQLCPNGWRVPTEQDFVDLDIALGGTGAMTNTDAAVIAKYTDVWGAVLEGECTADGTLSYQEQMGTYWTQSETVGSSDNGSYMYMMPPFMVMVTYFSPKSNGHPVRCVR